MRCNIPCCVWTDSMKRRWVIVCISSVALIGAGILVRTERKNRQLAKRAMAYRNSGRARGCQVAIRLSCVVLLRGGSFQRLRRGRALVPQSRRAGKSQWPSRHRLPCISKVKEFRRTGPRAHAGAEELRNKATLRPSTALASSIAEDKECRRTIPRLCAGIANLPINVIRRPNTP